jgi:hypothetical protein
MGINNKIFLYVVMDPNNKFPKNNIIKKDINGGTK